MTVVRIDVTDLVEFLQRQESVSGVQRVIAQTAPLLLSDPRANAVILDRGRGVFVDLDAHEVNHLLMASHASALSRSQTAIEATACLTRIATADPSTIGEDSVMLFLGAVWINDALMMAARCAHAQGARMVYLLYDLTPVKETGHTAAVNRLFERYLWLIAQTASTIPAISQSSRRDFVEYCQVVGVPAPPGLATGLPCGIEPRDYDVSVMPWPRPYALFVGTVESRKNHILAIRAWEQLIERHGAQSVPDLVCIGRLGWHASEFIDAYVRTKGLNGKVSLLSTSLSDEDLARFMAHAEFTVYPSRYEGWGLPVAESLGQGRLCLASNATSIPEISPDLPEFFHPLDALGLVALVERVLRDPEWVQAREAEIRARFVPTPWTHTARQVRAAIAATAGDRLTREAA